MKKHLPWILTAILAAWTLSALLPPRDKTEYHKADFGRLPVLLEGRVQPLDSVARNALLLIRGRQSVALEGGQRLSPTEWLLEVAFRPEEADQRKVFRLDHPELKGLLKLPVDGPNYFSLNEIRGQLDEVAQQAGRAKALEPANRSTFHKAVLRLDNALAIYHGLKNTLRPAGANDFAAELVQFQNALEPGIAAIKKQQAGQEFNQQDFDRLVHLLQRYEAAARAGYAMAIPPLHPESQRDAWSNIGASLFETLHGGSLHPAVTKYAALASAYRQSRPAEFNQALEDYRQWLAGKLAPEVSKGRLEFVFQNWQPFYLCTVIYLGVFLLGCCSWFAAFPTLNRSGYYLLALGFVVHTAGVLFRMFLEGRPPVTNLYSSAVFVGWGAVALGLVLEWFYRESIGLVMSSALGFITMIIAHNLALGGDTMQMMRAVLDTNFWLATHVITITLGYSATFVAGFLGIVYVLRGVFSRNLTESTAYAVGRMVYGIICFATLFSFVGTVLGGIWADQSWGRFWGWDPKENGALIIVLWNALILHARWAGLARERGLMNLAIFGNIVTAFSWFGVNMLGVGLHSYGFMDKAALWLWLFIASQLALISIGLLPERSWASFRHRAPMPDAAK